MKRPVRWCRRPLVVMNEFRHILNACCGNSGRLACNLSAAWQQRCSHNASASFTLHLKGTRRFYLWGFAQKPDFIFNKLFASKLWRDFNVSLVLFLEITTGVYLEFCLNTDVGEYEGNLSDCIHVHVHMIILFYFNKTFSSLLSRHFIKQLLTRLKTLKQACHLVAQNKQF